MNDSQKNAEFGRSIMVFVVLAVLTGLEYWLAVGTTLTSALIVVAILKASLVLQHFMHIARVFSEDGGH